MREDRGKNKGRENGRKGRGGWNEKGNMQVKCEVHSFECIGLHWGLGSVPFVHSHRHTEVKHYMRQCHPIHLAYITAFDFV